MLIDKNIVKSFENEHIKWFIKLAQKKDCSWTTKRPQKRSIYLSNFFNFPKNKSFEESIKPYIVGDITQIRSLQKKWGKITGQNANRLLEAFGYSEFKDKRKKRWSAFTFCKKLEVDVCPYCNRQYIFTVRDNGKNCITRPEIDHFFPKNIYPYISCNLYNFVPSCHICNNIKSTRNKQILYPYQDDFDKLGSFRLSYKKNVFKGTQIKGLDIIANKDNIHVKLKSSSKKFNQTVSLFHLEELYNMHKIELCDFLERYKNYRYPKIKEISLLLKNRQLNRSILEKYILGFPILDDKKQYPLKKFKKDIKEQLDNS